MSATPSAQSIFVANDLTSTITSYAVSATTTDQAPLGTIAGSATGLLNPIAVAVDAKGFIYVTCRGSEGANQQGSASVPDSIVVFAPNPSGSVNETPIATISGSNTGLMEVTGIALDAAGRIYVDLDSDGGQAILVFAANPTGQLNEAPVATISGAQTELNDPAQIAIDAAGKIYVADQNGAVYVYAAIPANGGTFSGPPIATIAGTATKLLDPEGVALDSKGDIFVSDVSFASESEGSTLVSSIYEFAPNPSGNVDAAPTATISGSNTTLTGESFLALDGSGRIYITQDPLTNHVSSRPKHAFAATNDDSGSSVVVFPANPTGLLNESPIRTIAGPATGLDGAIGIAVH